VKIGTWAHDGTTFAGFIEGERVFALPAGTTTLDLVSAGLAATLELGRRSFASSAGTPLAEVSLKPPIVPPSMRDFVAFEQHVEGIVKSVSEEASVTPEWYEAPTFYFTNPHTVRATGEDIAAPSGSHELDFELELAAVIGSVDGSDGINLDAQTAHQHIFGYTILNDWSARDLQRREMKVNLGPAKGKDFASTLGPWIVTADEFETLHDGDGFLPISMEVQINGQLFGRDSFSNIGWPFAELVAYASRNSRIVPGDVLGSGTTGGGCLAEEWGRSGVKKPAPLKPGDVVRMDVEGIGFISNRIVDGVQLPLVRPARTRLRTKIL
jgi:2-keto-4-pentenoate hydratase/2-oxohepta-3-ene-1,7-dioic acid hydratase in catechol pathway